MKKEQEGGGRNSVRELVSYQKGWGVWVDGGQHERAF